MMIYIKTGIDGDIDEIVDTDEIPSVDHIELNSVQADLLINHRYGFGVYQYIDGGIVENTLLIESLDVIKNRRSEYPSIEDQFDMIFHDLENGTKLWQDKLRAIKTKYPKV